MPPRLLAAVLLAALCLPRAGFARPGEDEDSLRLYDLRDLASVLPEDAARFIDEDATPTEALISQLCDANGLDCIMLLRGIAAVRATDEGHDALTRQLEEFRELYGERYQIEIACIPVERQDAPPLGAETGREGAIFLTRQVVARRHPTEISAVTARNFVADLSAVVGENAAAYDPEIDTVEEGISLVVLVGAGAESARGTTLRVRGEITSVDLERTSAGIGGEEDGLAIELPAVARRTVRSHLGLDYGRLTAVAVVDGFEPGQAIVIAAALRKIQ